MVEKSCQVGHNVHGQEKTAGCPRPVAVTCKTCYREYCAEHAGLLVHGKSCDGCDAAKIRTS